MLTFTTRSWLASRKPGRPEISAFAVRRGDLVACDPIGVQAPDAAERLQTSWESGLCAAAAARVRERMAFD